jgi:integrase
MVVRPSEQEHLSGDNEPSAVSHSHRGVPASHRRDAQQSQSNAILPASQSQVNLEKSSSSDSAPKSQEVRRRARRRNSRRQSHGSAWHWRQTDSWYFTLPGTKKRVPLHDEDGHRIRGVENKQAAQLALARVKLAGEWQPTSAFPTSNEEWLVAKVCSEYIQYCERGVANGTISKGHRDTTVSFLNDLCGYCGALPVAQLKKGHIRTWVENHTTWKSPATCKGAISIVLAAFNYAQENHEVLSPLKGLKKPRAQPRLQSFSKSDEEALYQEANEPFRSFLFAAMHTGLRPFCELARITADDIEETPRGMMWRVYSSKTKKTRKIPVRSEVATLTRQLMATAPRGSGIPLFRNADGGMLNKQAGVTRFRSTRKRLGWHEDPVRIKFSTYTCRHTFAHRMLSGYWNGGVGCSIETLAELIGDTPKVAFDHYGKEWGQHYQDPLWMAVGVAPATRLPVKKTARARPRRMPKRKTSRRSSPK